MARKRSSALVKTLVAMLSLIGLVLLLVILAIRPLFLLFIGGLFFVVVFVHRQRTSAKRRLAWQKAAIKGVFRRLRQALSRHTCRYSGSAASFSCRHSLRLCCWHAGSLQTAWLG